MTSITQRSRPWNFRALLPTLSALLALSGALPGCSREIPPVPAPPGLAVAAKGSGVPFDAGSPSETIRIRDSALFFADGTSCTPDVKDCPALVGLQSKIASDRQRNGLSIVLDIPPEAEMADLKIPLVRLMASLPTLGTGETCLRVNGGGDARCIMVKIRSEATMDSWMDAFWPDAKLRLFVKSDGMDVASISGKIPGPDRYGPSVPAKKGVHDFKLLAQDAARLSARYPKEEEIALLMSSRTRFQTAVTAIDVMSRASKGQFKSFLFIY